MTRFVLISDTHLQEPVLPQGDVLVHAGDFTMSGSLSETRQAMKWLGRAARNFEHVVCVGGNHDFFMYHAHAEVMRDFIRPYGKNIIYLENESAIICTDDKEIKIWGSPVQPEFCNWAWNEERGSQIKATWDRIPVGLDLLISHGPPMGILDWVGKDRVGCADLRVAVERTKPRYHVFGHIHSAGGQARAIGDTQFFNASVVDENYKLAYNPQIVDL